MNIIFIHVNKYFLSNLDGIWNHELSFNIIIYYRQFAFCILISWIHEKFFEKLHHFFSCAQYMYEYIQLSGTWNYVTVSFLRDLTIQNDNQVQCLLLRNIGVSSRAILTTLLLSILPICSFHSPFYLVPNHVSLSLGAFHQLFRGELSFLWSLAV